MKGVAPVPVRSPNAAAAPAGDRITSVICDGDAA